MCADVNRSCGLSAIVPSCSVTSLPVLGVTQQDCQVVSVRAKTCLMGCIMVKEETSDPKHIPPYRITAINYNLALVTHLVAVQKACGLVLELKSLKKINKGKTRDSQDQRVFFFSIFFVFAENKVTTLSLNNVSAQCSFSKRPPFVFVSKPLVTVSAQVSKK